MKKVVLSLVLMLSLCLGLASCTIPWSPTTPPTEEKENLIYDKNSELYLVYDTETISDEAISGVTQALFDNGISPRSLSILGEQKTHEIIFGKSDREVSKTAYARLERMDKNSEDDTRIAVYSDGSSVAFAYDDDIGNFTRDIAFRYFIDNMVAEELVLEKGKVYEECFNLYEYLAEKDAEYYEKTWSYIAETLGKDGEDVVEALRSYYTLYEGEKIITWVANLFDPSICICHGLDGEMECKKNNKYCGTGGFYYSNSARDNVGFLPDAESCAQALSIIGNCGITYGLPGSGYSAVVPEWMAKQICDFIYNLQEPDGFFYHPQWEKNITDSRRGRDLSWCNGILNTYNVSKRYTSASSSSYEFVPENEITGQLGASSVSAVSKVIATAAVAVAPHLETLEAFAQYLEDLDIYNNSYSAGNTLSAQASQINARGQEYVDLMMDKLNEVYNYYGNGTWHHTVNYYAINGVMKISGRYDGSGMCIPNAELTCRAAFNAIGSDEPVKDIVDIWNPWVAFNNCIDNIRKYADNGAEKAEALREELALEYAQAVIDTRDKLALFKKEDGSFSYQQKNSSSSSQGAPVAVGGTNEGDVNATVIATNNFTYELFQIIPVGRVHFCLTKERYVFLKAVDSLSPIVKTGTNADIGVPIDFDFDEVGYAPVDVAVSADASESDHGGEVVPDPREGAEGNVLKFTSLKGQGDNILISNNGIMVGATCQVFEGEFCFESINNGSELFRFEFGQGGDNINVYRMLTEVKNGVIHLYDRSSRDNYKGYKNNLGISIKQGEWFKLRVEYYVGDHNSVRIKIYVNDKLACVNDNYYDYNGKKIENGVGTPGSKLKNTRLYMLKDCEVTLLCDNLHSYNCKEKYEVEALDEQYASNKNIDARLLIEEGTEVGKRIPVMELPTVEDEEVTLSTLDLINKPVLILFWDNLSKTALAEVDAILTEYGDKISVYAVCSSEYSASARGYIKNNLPDSLINFVIDVRGDGAVADSYYTLLGASSYPTAFLLDKDSIITYISDEGVDYAALRSEIDKLFDN